MSTTHQSQINALMVDTLLKLREGYNLLAELYDDHNERLEKLESSEELNKRLKNLESNTAPAHTNDNNRDASATRPRPASCSLDTAMINTIRLTSQKGQNELADLVVKLCQHDEDTQKLAISLLLEGEGRMCSSTSHDPRSSAGPSKRRRM